MRSLVVILGSICIVLLGTACSQSKAPSTPATPEETAPAPDVRLPAASVPPPPSPSPAPSQGANPLIGTKWQYDGMTVYFKNEKMVFMQGGRAAHLAPSGLETPYTLKNGVLEVSLMGAKITGSYDGTTLIAEGKTATRIE